MDQGIVWHTSFQPQCEAVIPTIWGRQCSLSHLGFLAPYENNVFLLWWCKHCRIVHLLASLHPTVRPPFQLAVECSRGTIPAPRPHSLLEWQFYPRLLDCMSLDLCLLLVIFRLFTQVHSGTITCWSFKKQTKKLDEIDRNSAKFPLLDLKNWKTPVHSPHSVLKRHAQKENQLFVVLLAWVEGEKK